MRKEKTCQITEKPDGNFLIETNFDCGKKPTFLAKNPKNDELFLFFESFDKFFVFKGNKSEGLRLCKSMYPMMLPPYSTGFVFEDEGYFYLIVHSEFENSQEITLVYDETLKEEQLEIIPFIF